MAGYGNINNLTQMGKGRPKGSITKLKPLSTRDLLDALLKHDYDPVLENIRVAKDPECPHAVRAKINETFIARLYPAVKSVDHSGTVDHRAISVALTVDTPADAPLLNSVQTMDVTPVKPAAETVQPDDGLDDQ